MNHKPTCLKHNTWEQNKNQEILQEILNPVTTVDKNILAANTQSKQTLVKGAVGKESLVKILNFINNEDRNQRI